MPNTLVRSFAKRSGHSVDHVEELWTVAKASAIKAGKKLGDTDFYSYVVGTLRNMLKLKKESLLHLDTSCLVESETVDFSKFFDFQDNDKIKTNPKVINTGVKKVQGTPSKLDMEESKKDHEKFQIDIKGITDGKPEHKKLIVGIRGQEYHYTPPKGMSAEEFRLHAVAHRARFGHGKALSWIKGTASSVKKIENK